MTGKLLELYGGRLVEATEATLYEWCEAVAVACDEGDQELVIDLLATIGTALAGDPAFPIGPGR